MTTTRRLAAILAADVAGYSRLMAADEVGTLAALKACRREVVDPQIAAHKGRIVKTTGDGMLVEFASAVDAVTCAMAVQEKMSARGDGLAFRIGINVGDIIVDGDDIFGDGVNVATRVENECQPGGAYLSAQAFDQVRNKTAFAFDDLGERPLKNIDRPIRIYAVRSTGAVPTSIAGPEPGKPLPLPDKPSIAVLPFQNMSGDPEQEYFADGMVEEIITALSRFKSLFVISRNSSFTYKGRAVDIKQVGRQLGVRYVLEGSVRKASGRVRITGQLIDTGSGAHVWADRFDREMVDVFALQDDVAESVVSAVEPSLRSAEIARTSNVPTQNLNAYDLYLRALAENGAFTKDSLQAAEAFSRRAIELDPNYSDAWALLADSIFCQIIGGWRVSSERINEAKQAALISTRVGPENGYAHAIAGAYLMFFGGSADQAVEFAHRAIVLHPNSDMVRNGVGWTFVYNGEFEAGLGHFQAGLRMAPFGPRVGDTLHGMALAYFFQRNYDQAINLVNRALARIIENPTAWGLKTTALINVGRIDEAQDALRSMLTLIPKASVSKLRLNFKHQWMRDLFFDGLRSAGLPE